MSCKLSFLFMALAFTVACGSSDGGDNTTPQTIITMSGSVTVTGDYAVSGGFSYIGYTRQPSCAAYAAEGRAPSDAGPSEADGTFKVPGPPIGVDLAPTGDVYGSTLRIPPAIYRGSGTYFNDASTDQIFGQIVLNDLTDGPSYFLEDGTAEVTVNADGSGTLTFEEIPEDTSGIKTFISGTVTWTCTEDDQTS